LDISGFSFLHDTMEKKRALKTIVSIASLVYCAQNVWCFCIGVKKNNKKFFVS